MRWRKYLSVGRRSKLGRMCEGCVLSGEQADCDLKEGAWLCDPVETARRMEMRPVRTRAPERNGGEDLRKGKERAEGPRRKELLQKGTSRATINLQLEEHGKRQCHLIFRRGIQAEQQSLKGRSLVLYMLSGHGRQPVSRIWNLGETGKGKDIWEALTVYGHSAWRPDL